MRNRHRRQRLALGLSFTLFLLLASIGRVLFHGEPARSLWIVLSGVLALVLVTLVGRIVRRG
jgi:hypothetical protein